MNRSEVFNFLKVPFKERFMLACVLCCFPLLLAVPFISSLIQFVPIRVYQESYPTVHMDDLLYQWFLAQDTLLSIAAIAGFIVSMMLISGFMYIQGYSTIQQGGKVFDFKPILVTNKQVVKGILKAVSYFMWGLLYNLLCVMVLIILPILVFYIGNYVPSLFKILFGIVVILFEIAFFVLVVLNSWVAKFRFWSTLKTRVFFQWRKNYLYIKQYKGRFFLAFALCFVFGLALREILQIVFSLFSRIGSMGTPSLGLSVSVNYAVALLIVLVSTIAFVYIGLLQTTFIAKSIVWLEQKQILKKAKTVTRKKKKK